MGRWKRSKNSKYVPRQDPPGELTEGQSDSDLWSEESSGQQKPQPVAPSQPTMGRSGRFLDMFKSTFRFPSSPPGVEHRDNTKHPIATSTPQSLAVPASVLVRPHSSYSETSAIQMHGPSPRDLSPLTGDKVAFGDWGSPSSSGVQGSPFASILAPINRVSYPESIASENPAPLSTCAPHLSGPGVTENSSQSSAVWAKTLEIAQERLSDKNLPPLDLTNLTSQSAEENIEAVVKALNILQEDDKKKRWHYTWHGKEVIIVERLGKIFKMVEKYSKVVDTAIQSNPEVTALVWAGVWGILQVRI